MRVALDATPLTLSSGGLARYTAELSLALGRAFPEDEFILLSDQPFPMPPAAPGNLYRGDGPHGAFERRWWLWGLGRELRRRAASVFHGTDFAVPYLSRTPAILTLHDLSPWMDRGWHSGATRVRRRTPILIRLGCAAMVVTDTEAVRRQVIGRFRIAPGAVTAVPLGGLPTCTSPASPSPPHPRPYFLFVGTLEPRKNIPSLIEAWRAVRARHPVDLLLAGRRRSDFPALAPEPGLELLGEVPDSCLRALYAGALALVYPSHYEGFGLPVLEAMQAGGCAVISADPALLEVAGDAAIVARDGRELACAMAGLATRPDMVAAWKARAGRRGREFSWERTARLTREVYVEARRRFGY